VLVRYCHLQYHFQFEDILLHGKDKPVPHKDAKLPNAMQLFVSERLREETTQIWSRY